MIWGSWVYLWSFWPYLKIKYCLIWKMNIALFEHWILPYLNHDVFFDLFLKVSTRLIWKLNIALFERWLFFWNHFWEYLHALFENWILRYLNRDVFLEIISENIYTPYLKLEYGLIWTPMFFKHNSNFLWILFFIISKTNAARNFNPHVCFRFPFFYFEVPFKFQIRQYLLFNNTNDHQTAQI